ncbi:hypothetical protein ACL02S_11790 [Nocardia sp. 004]
MPTVRDPIGQAARLSGTPATDALRRTSVLAPDIVASTEVWR